jgi:hypothetical protein
MRRYLETLGCNKALDLGHLDGGLLALTTGHLTLEAVLLLHLVGLVKGEQLPDSGGTLGTEAARYGLLCGCREGGERSRRETGGGGQARSQPQDNLSGTDTAVHERAGRGDTQGRMDQWTNDLARSSGESRAQRDGRMGCSGAAAGTPST